MHLLLLNQYKFNYIGFKILQKTYNSRYVEKFLKVIQVKWRCYIYIYIYIYILRIN